jgi:hypothetical protein
MTRFLLFFFALTLNSQSFAQADLTTRQKGDFYFYWGYNRAAFTKSDIKFKGPGYDFTLKDVVAYDRPTDFDAGLYFNPASMTIPQYVYRLGYFINASWSISVGMDHMKYVMPQYQMVAVEGEINQPGNPYNGIYGETNVIAMDPDFLTFEHTDGLNYANFSADYFQNIYTSASAKFNIAAFGGGGIGMMIPKSNVQLMSGARNDQFHIAGYGLHADAGIQFTFWKHLFLRTQSKAGFIHMPSVLTRPNKVEDRASQHFWFGMWDFALGWQWHF